MLHNLSAAPHCQTCGGYIGDYGPRYAWHHDECSCQPCHRCQDLVAYRVTDDLGQDHCTWCAEEIRADMETN